MSDVDRQWFFTFTSFDDVGSRRSAVSDRKIKIIRRGLRIEISHRSLTLISPLITCNGRAFNGYRKNHIKRSFNENNACHKLKSKNPNFSEEYNFDEIHAMPLSLTTILSANELKGICADSVLFEREKDGEKKKKKKRRKLLLFLYFIEWDRKIVKYEILLPNDSLVFGSVSCASTLVLCVIFRSQRCGHFVRSLCLSFTLFVLRVHFIIYFDGRRIHEYFIDFTDSYLSLIRILVYRSMCVQLCEFFHFSFEFETMASTNMHAQHTWTVSVWRNPEINDTATGAIRRCSCRIWACCFVRVALLSLHVHFEMKCSYSMLMTTAFIASEARMRFQ